MKKQLHIEVTGHNPVYVDVSDDEGVYIKINNPPTRFTEGDTPDPSYKIDGLRWRNDEHFHLSWGGDMLNKNDVVTIKFVVSDKPQTPYQMEVKYIEPEKECSFCGKKSE